MDKQNPNYSPDFVHARSIEEGPASLKLVTFPDAFQCYTHTSIEETEFIYNEVFVKQEYMRHGLTLEGASCVFDIGANIGVFALFAKIKNPKAVIHAFEPIPETCDVLRRNVELHRLADVHVHNCAMGSQAAERRPFAYYPNMAGNSTATPAIKLPQLQLLEGQLGKDLTDFLFRSETRYASVQTLSGFLDVQGIPSIDFLKIDVEGDELAVLQGIDGKHVSGFRQLIVEAHSPQLADAVSAMLSGMGFRVFSDTGLASFPGVSAICAVNKGDHGR
ncbi:MAG: FkbM family methyltransferase [Anaerolineales bacterium]